MNLLKANLSSNKISDIELIRKNNDFCARIIEMIKETYEAVVTTRRNVDDVEYEVGRKGQRDMRGGQITDVWLKVSTAGVKISSHSAFAFDKSYNPPEYRIGHNPSDNVGGQNFGYIEIILREDQKDLSTRFKDLNTILQHCRFPIKL